MKLTKPIENQSDEPNGSGRVGRSRRRMVLLTGNPSCVGRRLLEVLASQGSRMRALVRRPQAMGIQYGTLVDMVAGDALDNASLARALRDIDVAYYLVTSRAASDSTEAERRAAWNFAQTAKAAKVRRIVYLSALGSAGVPQHLRADHEVGNILRDSGIQVIEFRCAMIIGAGGLPFELVRTLGERLPLLIAPSWFKQRLRPIGVRDAVSYLAEARDIELEGNHVFEIGGPDQVSYGDVVREYSRQRGLRRSIIHLPGGVLDLELWRRQANCPEEADDTEGLDEGGDSAITTWHDSPDGLFSVKPLSMRQAIADALLEEDRDFGAPNWFRKFLGTSGKLLESGVSVGNRIVLSKSIRVEASPAAAFAPIRRLGSANGWYFGRVLREIRNLIDRSLGGKRLTSIRRSGDDLAVGDPVDFWRVEQLIPNRKLTLVADSKTRGRAWIDFEVEPAVDGCTIRQSVIFDPKGLAGRFYWHLAYPLHRLILGRMLRGIAAAAPLRRVA